MFSDRKLVEVKGRYSLSDFVKGELGGESKIRDSFSSKKRTLTIKERSIGGYISLQQYSKIQEYYSNTYANFILALNETRWDLV